MSTNSNANESETSIKNHFNRRVNHLLVENGKEYPKIQIEADNLSNQQLIEQNKELSRIWSESN